ncbi:MAG: tripartite tricarboxylate transporter TctB family protein [Candidatus Binatia bacterium]
MHGEVLGGLFLCGLGIFILLRALSLDYTSDTGPGPGFVPLWLGIVITSLSLFLIVATLRKSLARNIVSHETPNKASRSLASWLAIMIGVALLKILGFYASFALLTAFFVLAMEKRSVPIVVAVAAGSAFGFYLIFSVVLRVPLPSGPWGF